MKKYLSDIEINQQARKQNIKTVAKNAGLTSEQIITYGDYKAKVKNITGKRKAKLVLVTAINPTPAGEGKTTSSIGLSEALNRLGYKSILALREPSLGPVFGVKGGATGGGQVQIAPIEDINLHFTGDLHAITTANNLISAAIDNHIYWGNVLEIEKVIWKRCMDMNDRALRDIEIQIKKDFSRKESFQITAASEIMAIFTLAKDLADLRHRIDNIVFAYNKKGKPLFVKDLKITGSVVALLKDAFDPNIVQTLEHNLALVHGGPFANIAHGCNSIVATDYASKLGDFVITEAGFGADLGAEKFLDIKTRVGKFDVNAVVIVATIRALKMQGGVAKADLGTSNVDALKKGIAILDKHIKNIKGFNLNYVVALNNFVTDSDEERAFIAEWATKHKHPFSFSDAWEKGGKGAIDLAKKVIDACANKKIKYTYKLEDSIVDKVKSIATNIYGAKDVSFSKEAKDFIKFLEKNNLDKQYVCMAKTPASITDDPKVMGVPKDWTLKVNNVTLSNGAGLIVVHCGDIMTMPGLSKFPQAERIDFDGEKITGLD